MLSSSIRPKKTTKPHHLHHRRHNHHHNSSLTTITDDELYDTSATSGDGTMTNIGHASDVIDEIPMTSSSLSDVITGASSAPRRYLSRMTSSYANAEPGSVQTGEHLNLLRPDHQHSTAQAIFDHNISLPPDYRVVLPINVTSPFADITEDSQLNRRSIPAFNPSFKYDYVQPLAAGSGWNDTIAGSVAVLTETTPGSSTAPSFSDRTRYLGNMDQYRTIQIRPRSRMTYPIAVFHPTGHPVTTPSEAAVFDSMVRRELLTFKIVFGTSAFVVIFVLILVLVFCVLLACGCLKSRRSHRKSRRTDRKTNDSRLPHTTDQATSALALNAPSPIPHVAPTLADAPVAAPSPVVPTPTVPPATPFVTPTVSSSRVVPMASATGIPAVSAARNSSSDCTTGVPATEGVDETVAAIQVADDHNSMAIGNAETKSESVEGHSKPDQGRWLVPNVVAHDSMHGLKTTTVPSSSSPTSSSAAATTTTPTLASDALGERIVDPSMRNILSAKLDGRSRKKKGWKVYSGQYVNEWFVWPDTPGTWIQSFRAGSTWHPWHHGYGKLNLETCRYVVLIEIENVFEYCAVVSVLNWIELNWIELNWIELNWIELNWIELNWIELNWWNTRAWQLLPCREWRL